MQDSPSSSFEFYRNVSPVEMAAWLLEAGFAHSRIRVRGHDVQAVAWKGNRLDGGDEVGAGHARYRDVEILEEPSP